MEFPSNIERWRSLVQVTLSGIRSVEELSTRILSSLGLSDATVQDIVLAIIQHESSGIPEKTGDNGCSIGLMQINWCYHSSDLMFLRFPSTDGAGRPVLADVESKDDLFTPEVNVGVGLRYLIANLNEFDSVPIAIIAYNGHREALRWIAGLPGAPSNMAYLTDVLDTLHVDESYFDGLIQKKNSKIWTSLGVVALFGIVAWISSRRSSGGSMDRNEPYSDY